jgi:hypothetical protein
MMSTWNMFMPGFTVWIAAISIVSLVIGAVVLFSSFRMYSKPSVSRPYGIAILVCSIVGIFFASGFGLGSVLGIIAGVIAVATKRQSSS